MRCFYFLFLFLIFIGPKGTYAQKKDFRFKQITTNDGLSQSTVTAMLQDSKGFMWFGTRDGLNRFDGYKFKVFKNDPGNRLSLSNNFVTDILEARTGALLIVTRSGLNRFNRDKNVFTRYN